MELPETCLTNVFKIENLSEIPYSVYRLSSTLGSAPAWRVLAKAEAHLRRQGKCVAICSDLSELWLFQTDTGDTDVAFSSDSGYNSYDGSGTGGWEPTVWGLEEKIKSVFHTQELFDSLNPHIQSPLELPLPMHPLTPLDSTMVSPGSASDHTDLTGAHRDIYMLQQLSKQRVSSLNPSRVGSPVAGSKSSVSGQSSISIDKPISKEEHISQKYMEAVMSLLSYKLSSIYGWIPLNISTFIPKSSSQNYADDILTYSNDIKSTLIVTTISLSLLEDGSLQISPKSTVQESLAPFPMPFSTYSTEVDVWLAPSGIVGRYTGKEANFSITQATPEWKAFALRSLSDRGIEVDNPSSWTRVGIWSEIEGFVEVFWPTSLLFWRKPNQNQSYPDLVNQSLPGNSSASEEVRAPASKPSWISSPDSLDFAESWLAGKSNRDLEHKRRLEIGTTIPQAPGLEKPPSVLPTTIDRSGTIYPTPPDGVSGIENHPTPGGMTAAPTPGQTRLIDDPSTNPTGPPTAPPTAEATIHSTDMDLDDAWLKDAEEAKNGDDDMFGDVQDVGLLGGDGFEDDMLKITDEDFEFFDEVGGDDFGVMGVEKPQTHLTELQMRPTTSALSENMNDLSLGYSALNAYPHEKLDLDMDMDLDIGAMDIHAELQSFSVETTQPSQPRSQPTTKDLSPLQAATGSRDTSLAQINPKASELGKEIIQVETPPLSPQRAMKLLLDAKSPTPGHVNLKPMSPTLTRRMSLYSPVDFPSFMGKSDEKYMAGGRFFCAEDETTQKEQPTPAKRGFSATFPRIKKYRSSRRPLSRDIMFLEDDEDTHGLIIDEDSSDEETTSTDDYESDDEDMFEMGNEHDSVSLPNSASPDELKHGLKRKRNPSERDYWGNGNKVQGLETGTRFGRGIDIEDDWSGAVVNEKDFDSISEGLRKLCNLHPADLPLDEVFIHAPDNENIVGRISSQDFRHVIVLLQEQVVWNTYIMATFNPNNPPGGEVSCIETSSISSPDAPDKLFHFRKQSTKTQDEVEDLLFDTFGAFASRCTLETLAYGLTGRPRSGYGVSPNSAMMESAGIPTGLPSLHGLKSLGDQPEQNQQIFKISPPQVHIHRYAAIPNSPLEILPPALHFWDTFGLCPHSGEKDALVAAILPKECGILTAGAVYLDDISSTYKSCRLGEILRVATSQIKDGLCEIGSQIPEQSGNGNYMLKRYCEGIVRLGDTLVEIEDELQNIVLFIVNPFSAPSAVVDICVAFHMLKKAYVHAFNNSPRVYPNNIILQIVPIRHIKAQDGFAVHTHGQTVRFALEMYERCTPTIRDHLSQTFPQESYSPALTLAKPPPKSISFKVSPDPSPAILHENMCLHMAYAQSMDERWVSVSWGDDCGEIKEVASFCLGMPGTMVLQPFEDICKEIWAQTTKILSKKRIHWRISLVKVGAIDEQEIEIWSKFIDNEPRISCTLSVFTADPAPAMNIKTLISSLSPQAFTGQVQLVSTPGATPQSSGVSPDQFGASSQAGPQTPGDTPAPEMDNDATLIDYTDETWGVVLKHPLNNSDSFIKIRPALASGYLVKRTGTNDTDEPVSLAVSLIRAGQRNSVATFGTTPTLKPTNDEMLRETLGQYRGLVTLAQHLGVIDMVKEVLPWHIGAVIKCRDAFSIVL